MSPESSILALGSYQWSQAYQPLTSRVPLKVLWSLCFEHVALVVSKRPYLRFDTRAMSLLEFFFFLDSA